MTSITKHIQDRAHYGTEDMAQSLNYGLGRFVSGIVHGYFLARELHATKEPVVSDVRFVNAVQKYLSVTNGNPLDIATKLPKLYDIVLRADAKASK